MFTSTHKMNTNKTTEEGKERLMAASITYQQRLLNTHVTALSVKENLVFIGEGQYCKVHDVLTGRQMSSTKVFCAAVVHGIRVHPSLTHVSFYWILLVFGQKSIAVLMFHTVHRKFFVLMEERSVEDWIVDADLEKDVLHLVIATGHNSMLRCELPNLAESCKNLEEAGGNYSKFSTLGQPHDLQSLQGTQESRTSKTQNGMYMSVVTRAACVERCVLFSGHLVMISGSWESAVMMAGTMALQVMIWGPWGPKDCMGYALPLHCLLGHQGSIFSITFCASQGLIATTSDDRSLKVWEVKHNTCMPVPLNPKEEQEYWRTATITEKFGSYGHRARVWRSLILPSCLVSVGEDSLVCVWDHSGSLRASWRAHDGASIWSVAVCGDPSGRLITGGCDGSVKSWCLNTAVPIHAEPMKDLPWSGEIYPQQRSFIEIADSLDASIPLRESADIECKEQKSDEFFSNTAAGMAVSPKEPPAYEAVNTDFPRCLSLIGDVVVVVTNNGRIYSYNPATFWLLEYENKALKNYAILEASPDNRHVAVGTLSGTVIILQVVEGGSLKAKAEAVRSSGKVFALQWLTVNRILSLGTGGVMTTWEIQNQGAMSPVSTHHLPVSMHRWLCAVYVPSTHTVASHHHLVCGDRAGSLHLYALNELKAQNTLRSVHGKNGVTNLLCWQDRLVYSSGRDGYVRSFRVDENCLVPLTSTRVSGSSWVSRLILVWGKLLAVCFHGVKLKLWSVEEEQTLLEVECGGAHRSWDLSVCGSKGQMSCAFLKDGLPYIFSTSLNNKLLPLIRPPLNTQETMNLRVLFQCRGETVFLTGGEDTTLRLHVLRHQGDRKSLSVVRSHLSGVRALCIVEDRHGNKTEKSTVWVVSAGGRAEFKVWQCSLNQFSNQATSANSCSCDSCNHLPGIKGNTHEPSSLQPQNVTMREVVSHMLRTGCHKTWKSQQLTLDPETRYMDVTAFWVSSYQALVALASSDGFLRIFFFLAECEKLIEACAVECSNCLLRVDKFELQRRTFLVTCSSRGYISFWDLQAVLDWKLQFTSSEHLGSLPQQSPHPQKLICVSAHHSGINALSFHYDTGNQSCITMATGGDDNKVSVWKIKMVEGVQMTVTHQCSILGHASQVSGLRWFSKNYLFSASIDQRLIIWKLCSKKDKNVDDQLKVSKISKDTACEDSQCLIPVKSWFIGVPDVKGITVIDKKDNENLRQKSHVDKRVFVYGMGLQIFDVSDGSL